MGRKLLILHDSPDFGGHEKMLLALLPAVLEDSVFDETLFCVPLANTRLRAALEAMPTPPKIRDWNFVKARGEPYLRRFRSDYRAAVRDLVAGDRFDTALLVQGRIEHLAVPSDVLPRSMRVVSYLPMAHRLADMGRRMPFADTIRRRLYRRPDQFIVPSAAVATQVAAAGGRAPAIVVPNVVDAPSMIDKATARAQLGLPGDKRIALFLGRLDTAQKGLDLLVGAVARAGAERLRGWTFVVVGDGPGRALVKRTAAIARLDIRLVEWTYCPAAYCAAADIMLLPSRWEGVPLVMLEAMRDGLPILASPIDAYRLHLPEANLVDFDTIDLAAALDRLTTPAAIADYQAVTSRGLRGQTLEMSRRRFADAVTGEVVA